MGAQPRWILFSIIVLPATTFAAEKSGNYSSAWIWLLAAVILVVVGGLITLRLRPKTSAMAGRRDSTDELLINPQSFNRWADQRDHEEEDKS